MKLNIDDLAWEKSNGLIPAIVQHAVTGSVLMLGHMDREALQKTIETKLVTFFSRSKNRLWTKGESSGNALELVNIFPDCDQDTLLVFAKPKGPVCHNGTATCFAEANLQSDWNFIQDLEKTIQDRERTFPEKSYTAKLLGSGRSRTAQKVGEEAIEVVLAAIEKDDNGFCSEVADLLFHVLVLLRARNLCMADIVKVLRDRRQ